jgi:chromosome segregation ATPase
MNETAERQHYQHTEAIQQLTSKLGDAEARLRDAELQIVDHGRTKAELADTLENLEQSRAQCRQLAETLRRTQQFLAESKRHLSEEPGGLDGARSPQRHLKDRVVELEQLVEGYERRIAQLQSVDAMNADLLERISHSRNDQKRIADLEQENEQLKLKMEVSDLSHASITRKAREAEIRNSELQRQVFDLQNTSEAAFSVSGQIDALREENRKLRNEIDHYETGPLSPSRLTKQNRDLAVQLDASKMENEALHRQIETLIRTHTKV